MWLNEILETMIEHPWATFFLFAMIYALIDLFVDIFKK